MLQSAAPSSKRGKRKKASDPSGMDAFASADDYEAMLEQFDPEIFDGGNKHKKPLKNTAGTALAGLDTSRPSAKRRKKGSKQSS